MKAQECERVVRAAFEHYCHKMDELPQFPLEQAVLAEKHLSAEKEAVDIVCKGAFAGDDNFQQKIQNLIAQYKNDRLVGGKYLEYTSRNEKASKDKSLTILKLLYEVYVEDKIRGQQYFPPKGTFQNYEKDRDTVKEMFCSSKAELGPKKHEALMVFFKGKEAEQEMMLKSCKVMDETEKKLLLERAAREKTDLKLKCAAEKEGKLARDLQNLKETSKMNAQAMEKRMQDQLTSLIEEHNRTLEAKLKEQERLMKQEMKEDAEAMNREISELRKAIEVSENEKEEIATRIENLQKEAKSGCSVA